MSLEMCEWSQHSTQEMYRLYIATELKRHKEDIPATSETKFTGERLMVKAGEEYIFFWSELLKASPRTYAVWLAIRSQLLQTVPESPKAVNKRLMT